MTNSKHIPKRRFKEFESDSDWEETKLRELFQYIGNAFVGTATPYYVESGHFYLESNNIKDGQINHNTEVFINDEFYQKQKNKWLQTGDMVMVQSGHVGHTAVIPENLNNSAAHALIMFRNPSENLESYFLNYQYQTTKAKEKIKTITTGNTIQHILASDMKEFKVYISNPEEQKKIGKFFQTIDSLITLHQHKLDKLKSLKKSYLAELFPAEGERLPKRRFPGFEGEWEEKKLASIASMHARIGWQNLRTSEFLDHGDYYLITGTDFLDGHINFDKCHYVDEKRFQQDKNIQVVNGSILITKDGTLGKVAIVNNLDKPATLNAGVFNVVVKDSNIDVKYLYQYLAAPYLMNYVSKRATGGTIKHLNQNILVDFPIYFPEYKEQKTIGNFLEKLDKSISHQQQKLDKLKDLKKAYLNELFV